MKSIYSLLSMLLLCSMLHAQTPATQAASDAPDLGAMVQPVPMTSRMFDPEYHIWCGAPVGTPDGKYHLFYCRWRADGKDGFMGWATRSEIAYAVADDPFGPYKHVNVALPARGKEFWDGTTTHNANIQYHNGKFYLFYMGNTGDGVYPTHRNNQRVGLAIADKPEGPWTRFDKPIISITDDKKSFDSLCVTNPAGVFRPDGSVLVIYKAVEYVEGKLMGGKVRYGAAIAQQPEGPYLKQADAHIFEDPDKNSKEWMLAEDPYIWYSKLYGNKYYAVARDVVGRFTGAKGGICMFQSEDGLHWQPTATPKVLGINFPWTDGTVSKARIERPSLLLKDEVPIALFGATNGYGKGKNVSYNVFIPLKAK